MLLNCAVFAALYRPLKPTLKVAPLKPKEAEAIKSLLQLAANEQQLQQQFQTAGSPSGEAPIHAVPITSQENLRDQVIKEEEEEEEDYEEESSARKEKLDQLKAKKTKPDGPLTTIAEGPEGEAGKICRNKSSLYRTTSSF